MIPEPVTADALAQRYLDLGRRHVRRCDVCDGECSWTNAETGTPRHAGCEPKESTT